MGKVFVVILMVRCMKENGFMGFIMGREYLPPALERGNMGSGNWENYMELGFTKMKLGAFMKEISNMGLLVGGAWRIERDSFILRENGRMVYGMGEEFATWMKENLKENGKMVFDMVMAK